VLTERFPWIPHVQEAYEAMTRIEAFVARSLDKKLLELIKTRASQINGCAFCLHMHSKEARRLGESDARLLLLSAWHESTLFSAKERAALAWCESLTLVSATHVPDSDYEEARRHFADSELAVLSLAVAMINVWNRLQVGFRAVHPAELKVQQQP
jgi:AhpD family alkylhydroperoxidase